MKILYHVVRIVLRVHSSKIWSAEKNILSAEEFKSATMRCLYQIMLAYFRAFVHALIYMCACTNAQTITSSKL